MPESPRINLPLPAAIHAMAAQLAEVEQRSLASVAAFAVEQWLHANYSHRLKVYQAMTDLKAMETPRG